MHTGLNAQDSDSSSMDDLLQVLNEKPPGNNSKKVYTAATFKTTRIANGHSIEQLGKGVLDFRINHRFGMINGGISEFFGLDNATTRIGFDYGITDALMVGVGRSTFLKEVDGFIKWRLLRQQDQGRMPVTVSYLGSASVLTGAAFVPDGYTYYFSNRMAYINQLLVARKFSAALSLQLMPTFIHYNFVQFRDEPNDIFALGFGGRLKMSKRISLTAEYYLLLPPDNRRHATHNALTLGVDIETGGHVFQLLFSNATGISERTGIGQSTGLWQKGDIHFGFNISRVFTVVRPKAFRAGRNRTW